MGRALVTEFGYSVLGGLFVYFVCRGMIADARRTRDFWYEMYRKADAALSRLARGPDDGPYR